MTIKNKNGEYQEFFASKKEYFFEDDEENKDEVQDISNKVDERLPYIILSQIDYNNIIIEFNCKTV